jgi:signal transduction histidine kinase
VVAGAVHAWAERARLEAVDVTLASPGHLEIAADPDRLRQAIDNLVGNALRFAPRGSAIEVVLRSSGGFAVLEVADRGPGFPAGFLPIAFERFSRPDDRPDDHEGSGLGLAIVRTVVEAHDGQVQAANRPGGGALVRIVLPAETHRS